jgi:murein DD-endopeptidase MepM/ murein hydrolase activator NlpD
MIKKIGIALLILCFLISLAMPSSEIEAKTLNDIYNELNQLKAEKADNIAKKNQTQAQISQTRSDIIGTSRRIEQAELDIVNAEKEIDRLNNEIAKKDSEIKELMNFLQVSQGESEYLEYAFGAQDLTDFIYRLAITEQLSSYNDKLLKEMNNMIVENENKKIRLNQMAIALATQRKNLSQKIKSLGNTLNGLTDASLDIDAEIDAISKLIRSYETMGCKRYDNLSVCAHIPPDSTLARPISHGYITSSFGYREYYLRGKLQKGFHYGMDMASSSGDGTPIRATANGRVAAIFPRQSCGGNMLFIHHIVNGKYYTSAYFHLLSINVNVGDVVSRGSLIGYMGGGKTSSSKGGYDTCTTGTHLHFEIATGHYLGAPPYGYSGWDNFLGRSVNPRNYINFPSQW